MHGEGTAMWKSGLVVFLGVVVASLLSPAGADESCADEAATVECAERECASVEAAGEKNVEIDILDLPLVETFHYERQGDHRELSMLDLPLVDVVKAERGGPSCAETDILDCPGVELYKSRVTPDRSKREVLDLPGVALVRSTSEKDGDFDRQFLKLPLVGSLFRVKKSDNTHTVGVFFLKFRYRSNAD